MFFNVFYFLVGQNFLFFDSIKPTKLLDRPNNEHKDDAEPNQFESESSSEADKEP